MSLELTGKMVSLLPQQTGEGKNGKWVKQEFIIETPGEYPRKVCVSAWGDKAKDAENLRPGDTIKVSINIESREYSGRWYTDVRAWRIDKVSEGSFSRPTDELPSPPPPSIDDIPGEPDNDLPF